MSASEPERHQEGDADGPVARRSSLTQCHVGAAARNPRGILIGALRACHEPCDDEWAFAVPYLALCREDAPQRRYSLRDTFDALRYIVRSGAPWRHLPGDFPPWQALYQQAQRWLRAGVFELVVRDLRRLVRLGEGRAAEPTGVVLDGRTRQSTPESGSRAGYDGYKRRKGSKVHLAVDTPGQLLALVVAPANEQERAQVEKLAAQVQEVTGEHVEVAYVDQGHTGAEAAEAAEAEGIQLCVVRLEEAKRGFVLLPRRWVVERSFGWMSRFRRLARDHERLSATLAGYHFVAFALLMGRSISAVLHNAPWLQSPQHALTPLEGRPRCARWSGPR